MLQPPRVVEGLALTVVSQGVEPGVADAEFLAGTQDATADRPALGPAYLQPKGVLLAQKIAGIRAKRPRLPLAALDGPYDPVGFVLVQ